MLSYNDFGKNSSLKKENLDRWWDDEFILETNSKKIDFKKGDDVIFYKNKESSANSIQWSSTSFRRAMAYRGVFVRYEENLFLDFFRPRICIINSKEKLYRIPENLVYKGSKKNTPKKSNVINFGPSHGPPLSDLNESENISKKEKKVNQILDKNPKKKLSRNEIKKLNYLSPPKNIELCDNVTYKNPESEHFNKKGVVVEIRDDGKFVVRFKDGSRLACYDTYLIKNKRTKSMKKIDPYDEEDWG